MTHYLVVAHRTPPGACLADALTRIAADDAGSAFTLLVTATHPLRALKGHTPELEAAARDRAALATAELRGRGIYLTRAFAGDGAAGVAIGDELRAQPDRYDAIALVTPRPGTRAWLRGDERARIEADAGLPVLHLYPGVADPWRREPRPRLRRASQLWARTRPRPGAAADGAPTRAQLLPILVFVALYLLGGLGLALAVSPAFFLNDGVAIVVYSLVLGGVVLLLRSESGST